MRARLTGRLTRDAVAIVGAWDPFLPAHGRFAKAVARYAAGRSLASVALLLHPHPASFLHGARSWPHFHCVEARAQLLRACGVDAVLIVRFGKADLNLAAAALFDLAEDHCTLAEVWLGANQSLGAGPGGSFAAIASIAQQRRIELRRLPRPTGLGRVWRARGFLASGRVARAAKLGIRPPLLHKPRFDTLPLAWPAGSYVAVPTAGPAFAARHSPIVVDVVRDAGRRSVLVWPDPTIQWLSILAGPGDNVASRDVMPTAMSC